MNAIAITLHGLVATLWVGGMFFAYLVLRPAVASLEPHRKLTLWNKVFALFFPWVWVAVLILPTTGYWLIFGRYGGFSALPVSLHIMHVVGLVMILVFGTLYFWVYPPFKQAVIEQHWSVAGIQLNKVRRLVLVNLILGLFLIVIAFYGP